MHTYNLGQRIKVVGKGPGTIKYVGKLHGQEGLWLGIEWDFEGIGKNNGDYKGEKYFNCIKSKNSGSFINASSKKINVGVDLFEAIYDRYVRQNLEYNAKELPLTIDDRYGSIEAVGFEKIINEQRNLENLRAINLENSLVDRVEKLTRALILQVKNVVELNLSCNLICDWRQVQLIGKLLTRLESLSLSGNQISFFPTCTSHEESATLERGSLKNLLLDDGSPISFNSLTYLNLSATMISWEKVLALENTDFPNLKELVLCDNRIEKLSFVSSECFACLEKLDLSNNFIADSSELNFISHLPRLKHISVSGNPLDRIAPPSYLVSKDTNIWKNVTTIEANDINISDWTCVSDLDLFPNLSELGLRRSKLTLKNKDHSAIRAHIVGRLKRLVKLNGTTISASERRELELIYINDVRTETKTIKSSGSSNIDNIVRLHPRYIELCNKFGFSVEPTLDTKVVHANSGPLSNLKSRVLLLNILLIKHAAIDSDDNEYDLLINETPYRHYGPSSTISRKFTPSTSILQFKAIIPRLFKQNALKVGEIYRKVGLGAEGSMFIELDNLSRDLHFYDIQNSESIYVIVC